MHEMPGKKNMHRAYALCIFFFPEFFVLADAGALPARLKVADAERFSRRVDPVQRGVVADGECFTRQEGVSRYVRPDFISL